MGEASVRADAYAGKKKKGTYAPMKLRKFPVHCSQLTSLGLELKPSRTDAEKGVRQLLPSLRFEKLASRTRCHPPPHDDKASR